MTTRIWKWLWWINDKPHLLAIVILALGIAVARINLDILRATQQERAAIEKLKAIQPPPIMTGQGTVGIGPIHRPLYTQPLGDSITCEGPYPRNQWIQDNTFSGTITATAGFPMYPVPGSVVNLSTGTTQWSKP